MNALSGKVAIVTGASSGIGYATSKLFANEGADVVVAARRQVELDSLVDDITQSGGRAIALAGDVKDEHFARAVVDLAIKHFGGLDIAFNNAGTMEGMGDTCQLELSAWEHTISTNLTSAFLGAKYQIPALLERGSGSLIFTSSFVGYTAGFPQTAAYSASKAGIVGLTQALATEFGPKE